MSFDPRDWSITTKIVGLCALSLTVLTSALLIVAVMSTRAAATAGAADQVNVAQRVLLAELQHEGAPDMRGGRLRFGAWIANGNFALLDNVKRMTGADASLFAIVNGVPVRVNTTVTAASGKGRIVGTELRGPARVSFQRGSGYSGSAPILGRPYVTRYSLVRDRRGATVAIAFTGIPLSAVHEAVVTAIRAIVSTAAVTLTLAIAAMIVMTRSIARRLGAVTTAISTIVHEDISHLVEVADAIARGEVHSEAAVRRPALIESGSDEAAILAQSYNALAQHLTEVDALFLTVTESLSDRAFYDGLTGLANRSLFLDRVKGMIARNQRRNDHFAAIIFMDLDGFKRVNDSLGHSVGDGLLIAVARRMERCLRTGDTVARLGGDEFGFLLEDISCEAAAVDFAERLLSELAHPFVVDTHELFTSASVGIALTRTGFDAPESLLRNADIAMYQAKRLGKSRCVLFTPEFLEHVSGLLELDRDIKAAVERHEFVVFYQPIVALQTGALTGFEALVRWQHPRRGLLAPADFIPAAEESGSILAIGAQVLHAACRQARGWLDTFGSMPKVPISINVSASQFSDPRLIHTIRGALRQFHLSEDDLHIEITESAIMGSPDVAAATLGQLKRMGIEVHLDDFGTGYSSLGYLHQFPVNTIKIDRSFISMSGSGVGHPEIVRTICSLADALSMQTTVEGIETQEQLTQLRSIGCTNGQGYFFSRPIDATAATKLRATWEARALEQGTITAPTA